MTKIGFVKSYSDHNNRRVYIGDYVEIFDPYQKKWTGRILKVKHIIKQGNGVSVKFDEPPILKYPHHFVHFARNTRLVKRGEKNKEH